MTRAQFDKVVNEEPFLSADRLLELKWIDRVGRQAELKDEVQKVTGRRTPTKSYPVLSSHRWMPDETWGPKPTIALVYQIGALRHGRRDQGEGEHQGHQEAPREVGR